MVDSELIKAAHEIRSNPVSARLTAIHLINCMNEDGDMEGEMRFYSQIINEILEGDLRTITDDEMTLFLVMQTELIKLTTQCKQQ